MLKSLLLAGSIQALFFILLLSAKKEKANSDRLLMLWFGVVAFQLLFYYDNLSGHPLVPGWFQLLGFSLPLLGSPIFYLYIYSLSFGNKFRWNKIGTHLLPYIVFNIILFCISMQPGSVTVSQGFTQFSNQVPRLLGYFLTNLLAIIPGFYTILSLFVLVNYQKLLPDNYSYTERINLNWLKWIVISLLLLFVALFLVIKYSVGYGLLTYDNLFQVVGAVLACYLFFISYFGFRQTFIFANIPVITDLVEKTNSDKSYRNSGLNDEKADLLFQKLKFHMQEHKPFLDEDLSLVLLAGQLGVTANQLSQVINQKSSSNFFTFINSYRVEAVRQKLKDPTYAQYSIVAIGYDCGFRSKSSFNKIFKEMTGQTPSEYQKS